MAFGTPLLSILGAHGLSECQVTRRPLPGLPSTWANIPDFLTFLNILWGQSSPPRHSQQTWISICLLLCGYYIPHLTNENFSQPSHLPMHTPSPRTWTRKKGNNSLETHKERNSIVAGGPKSLFILNERWQPYFLFKVFSEYFHTFLLQYSLKSWEHCFSSVLGCAFFHLPAGGT